MSLQLRQGITTCKAPRRFVTGGKIASAQFPLYIMFREQARPRRRPLFPHTIMHIRTATLIATALLAGCATRTADTPAPAPAPTARTPSPVAAEEPASAANTVDAYKRDLALRIAQANAAKVFAGRPQALLRSVIVLRYAIDANGRLVHSEIQRSNRDRETESTALASLRGAAPFPKPAPHLLRRGRLELSETWLFNNDGRFQLRTIAEAQMDR